MLIFREKSFQFCTPFLKTRQPILLLYADGKNNCLELLCYSSAIKQRARAYYQESSYTITRQYRANYIRQMLMVTVSKAHITDIDIRDSYLLSWCFQSRKNRLKVETYVSSALLLLCGKKYVKTYIVGKVLIVDYL